MELARGPLITRTAAQMPETRPSLCWVIQVLDKVRLSIGKSMGYRTILYGTCCTYFASPPVRAVI